MYIKAGISLRNPSTTTRRLTLFLHVWQIQTQRIHLLSGLLPLATYTLGIFFITPISQVLIIKANPGKNLTSPDRFSQISTRMIPQIHVSIFYWVWLIKGWLR